MNSLKVKLMVALIGSNILVMAIFAMITPWQVEKRFLDEAKSVHYQNFAQMIGHYIQQNGSWNTLEDALRFAHLDSEMRNHRAGFYPPRALRQEIPFKFVVSDIQGHVVIGGKDYQPGAKISSALLSQGEPIRLNGETVAYALPSGKVPLTASDRNYLKALKESLAYAFVISFAILIPLGLWEGHKLVNSLKRLISAVEKMEQGELAQQVTVRSNDEVGRLAAAFNTMSSQIVRQAEQLKELSIRDALTGLYNRRFFNEEVASLYEQSIQEDSPFCLVLGDVDYFKMINDRYSHTVGDLVLQQIAGILQSSCRDKDVVARYGGEEFVIALANSDIAQAIQTIERIRMTIESHPWQEIAAGLRVTMSFGISSKTDHEHMEHLLLQADQQLYLAKDNGRNRVSSA
ncbi:diguanylate cyclase [Vibrio mangrovi]|uniref:diguanylate cyclase n=1 Tax=Vibrio mangrovi TaxID=474394 RepID=A0A1Y6IZA2_9VIBR|nr:diguanylate cyclase [Vibrio mangrovi]MDW6005098.1 diguanylate cyclase [Vibrio mangrovi]SMS02979.1 Response regulator PleD [Vibrio mangrovi]